MSNLLASYKIKSAGDIISTDGVDSFPPSTSCQDLHDSPEYPHTLLVFENDLYLVRAVPENEVTTASLVNDPEGLYTVDAVPHVVEIPGKTADLFGGHPPVRPPRPA